VLLPNKAESLCDGVSQEITTPGQSNILPNLNHLLRTESLFIVMTKTATGIILFNITQNVIFAAFIFFVSKKVYSMRVRYVSNSHINDDGKHSRRAGRFLF
jgi:hypothetical protein